MKFHESGPNEVSTILPFHGKDKISVVIPSHGTKNFESSSIPHGTLHDGLSHGMIFFRPIPPHEEL